MDTTGCGNDTDPTWACNAWRTTCAGKCTASFVAANKPTCPPGQTYSKKCGVGGLCTAAPACPSDKPYRTYGTSAQPEQCVAVCPAGTATSGPGIAPGTTYCSPCGTGYTGVNNVCTAAPAPAPAPAPADSTSSQPAAVQDPAPGPDFQPLPGVCSNGKSLLIAANWDPDQAAKLCDCTQFNTDYDTYGLNNNVITAGFVSRGFFSRFGSGSAGSNPGCNRCGNPKSVAGDQEWYPWGAGAGNQPPLCTARTNKATRIANKVYVYTDAGEGEGGL